MQVRVLLGTPVRTGRRTDQMKNLGQQVDFVSLAIRNRYGCPAGIYAEGIYSPAGDARVYFDFCLFIAQTTSMLDNSGFGDAVGTLILKKLYLSASISIEKPSFGIEQRHI